MKKFSLILLCATALTYNVTMVNAQDNITIPTPQQHEQRIKDMKQHHEKMENKLADKLKLTEEQRAKAKQMREDSRKKIKPLMKEMKDKILKFKEKLMTSSMELDYKEEFGISKSSVTTNSISS